MGHCSNSGRGAAGGIGKNSYNKNMYETVGSVRGLDIYRMPNTKGAFHVKPTKNIEMSFKTIKAAKKFIMSIPANVDFRRGWGVDGTGVFRYTT